MKQACQIMIIFTKTILFSLLLLILSTTKINAQTKPIVKDDPINRSIYEIRRLISPETGKIPDNIREKELYFAKQLPKNYFKNSAAANWLHRGPFNVGGRTRALSIDRNNENIILAGGVSGGMWRSVNGGSSWTKVTALDDLHSVTAIAQDPINTNIWYYGTGEISGNSARASGAPYRGNGIYKSTDNGQSWTLLNTTTTNQPETFNSDFQYCWNIKVSPANSYVYVATYGRIYRSTDAGANWTAIFNSRDESLSSPSSSYVTDLTVDSNGKIYIAVGSDGDIGGFFLSLDNGDSWINITPDNTNYPNFPTDYDRTVIAIAPSNENIVYFLTYVGKDVNDNPIHNLWKYSFDPNNNSYFWTDLSANLPAQGGQTGNFDSQGGYDLLIKVKPDDENFVIIGGTDLWRSTDGFSSTDNLTKIGGYAPTNDTYSSYSNHHADQHSLVFYPSDNKKVISGHDGGLSVTSDISNTTVSNNETVVWTSLNSGYLTTQAYAVAIDMETNGNEVIVAGFQDNGSWRTDNSFGTVSWFDVGSGDGAYCAVINAGNEYYQSSQNGTVYRNWLETGSWKWTQVDPDGATDQDFINPFVLDPNNTKMMYYLGGKIIWRNNDLTEIPAFSNSSSTINWDKMNNTNVGTDWISNLDVSSNPANILYYGTYGGKLYKVEDANTGDPIPAEITGSNFPNATIGCVKVNPYDTSELFVSFTNYEVISIWHTSDGGQNWESISGNLEENIDGSGSGPSVRWIELLKKDNGDKIYFAGTSTGLYTSTNLNGDNTVWTQESPDLIGNVIVDMIKVRKDGTVVLGTHGNGIYSALFDGATSIEKNRLNNHTDAKIYPNPSNGKFTIETQNDLPANYKVIIYNLKGQAVFYGEENATNQLKLNVDMPKQAKGIYTIELIQNGKAQAYKILIK